MRLVVVAVLAASCISPVMKFGGGKTPRQAQHDRLSDLLPARLDVSGTWVGAPTTATIRVYADDTYRTQNLNWQKSFEEPLEYANAVLGPMFGVRLRADYRVWNRHPGGGRLGDDLAALQAHDPGERAFAVVGLTSSLSLVSATFDELGKATVDGRHLVMRGYADVEERTMFARAFPDLDDEERDSAHASRRMHKRAALLLHELGHVLGWEHDDEGDTIMAPFYSHRASTFSPASRTEILAGVDRRLARNGAAEAAPPIATVAPAPPPAAVPRLIIFVTEQGDVLVDGKAVDAKALELELSALATFDKKGEVIIKRARRAPAAKLVEIIDRAKAHGLENFTLGHE